MNNSWTAERRARQAARLRTLKPWLRSTGPRTSAGKARSACNAYKGGLRTALRELSRALNEAMQNQLAVIDKLQR